jgi:hypothetical protein
MGFASCYFLKNKLYYLIKTADHTKVIYGDKFRLVLGGFSKISVLEKLSYTEKAAFLLFFSKLLLKSIGF